jgi:hypothetical protein
MWRAGVVLTCLLIVAAAYAEPAQPSRTAAVAAKGKTKTKVIVKKSPKAPKTEPKKKEPTATAPNPLSASYAAVPLAVRVSIQADLLIIGDYEGPLNGEFGDAAINAVKAFQKRKGNRETGILNPVERVELANAAKPRQTQRGWQVVDDVTTGVRVFVPTKMMPQASQLAGGSRWASARGEMAIETFREARSGTTLAAVFAEMKKGPPGRRVNQSAMEGDSFEISGLQNLKLFQVRGYAKGEDVRGVTILYDQALEGIVTPVATAVTNAFVAFPTGVAAPAPKSKVEYASGFVVSNDGHIVTDAAMLEGCQVLTIGGIGGVDRLAEDQDKGLLLLRVYGARRLRPLALAGETTKAPEVTILGIAEPDAQNGGSAVSIARAKLSESRALDPAPGAGFTGAAALDPVARLTGMVTLKPALVAGMGAAPQATLLGVETIRNFLDAQNVRPAVNAASDVEGAKAGIVRVICVRK